jgi:predicted amidohydrolase
MRWTPCELIGVENYVAQNPGLVAARKYDHGHSGIPGTMTLFKAVSQQVSFAEATGTSIRAGRIQRPWQSSPAGVGHRRVNGNLAAAHSFFS